MPRQILVMRHAEKPADPSDPDLSPEDVARAKASSGWLRHLWREPL